MALLKKKDKAPRPAGGGKIAQIREAYTMTRRADKLLPLYLLFAFAFDFVVIMAISLWIGQPIIGAIFGVFTGVMAALIVFGQRVQKVAYAEVEGQPGAAAAVLNTMKRGGWTMTPGVAVNKSQDIVHRAVGKAGIVLIGEGSPGRVSGLLDSERKRMNRLIADIPVTEIVIGEGEGQVPLAKLTKFMMRLPKKIKGGAVVETNDRLRAVGDLMKNVPLPKGPMPKGARMPKR